MRDWLKESSNYRIVNSSKKQSKSIMYMSSILGKNKLSPGRGFNSGGKMLATHYNWYYILLFVTGSSSIARQIIIKNMFNPGIEPGTVCVLSRRDNHYTNWTSNIIRLFNSYIHHCDTSEQIFDCQRNSCYHYNKCKTPIIIFYHKSHKPVEIPYTKTPLNCPIWEIKPRKRRSFDRLWLSTWHVLPIVF